MSERIFSSLEIAVPLQDSLVGFFFIKPFVSMLDEWERIQFNNELRMRRGLIHHDAAKALELVDGHRGIDADQA